MPYLLNSSEPLALTQEINWRNPLTSGLAET
jgi:hypothetical protein